MAEQVRVKIKGIVVTSRYGTLSSGQIVRTDAEYARHLVEQCHAGEYLDVVKQEGHSVDDKSESKSRKVRRNAG